MLKAALKRGHYQTANPRIAGRRADTVLANVWLAEGAPIGDVLTMLEFRHRFGGWQVLELDRGVHFEGSVEVDRVRDSRADGGQ